jgi:hypothetical protein
MKTLYYFHSESDPEVYGFTDDAAGAKLPADKGPWTLLRHLSADQEWTQRGSKAAVMAGVAENGFSLHYEQASSKPIIESDRVEGTAVFDANGRRIGEIQRLLIEKVSGQVLYADMTFGGFLGLGAHHHTIPWGKLAYDTTLGGYRTDITEEQVRGAPTFSAGETAWSDRNREREVHDHWNARYYWGGWA